VREEPAIDDQPGVVVNDQEQPGAHRMLDARPGHPWADEDVGDPPVIRRLSLVTAEHFRLGLQGLAVQPGASQLGPHRALGDSDAVTVPEDRGDLGGRSGRELQP